MESPIDAFDKSKLLGELMKGSDASVGDGVNPITELVVQVVGGEHGLGAAAQVVGIESSLESLLALLELLV
jgi:hypothetical protein